MKNKKYIIAFIAALLVVAIYMSTSGPKYDYTKEPAAFEQVRKDVENHNPPLEDQQLNYEYLGPNDDSVTTLTNPDPLATKDEN